jgi:hypothetical protein
MNGDSEEKCAFQRYIPTRKSFFIHSNTPVGLACGGIIRPISITTVDYMGNIIINNNSTIQR